MKSKCNIFMKSLAQCLACIKHTKILYINNNYYFTNDRRLWLYPVLQMLPNKLNNIKCFLPFEIRSKEDVKVVTTFK